MNKIFFWLILFGLGMLVWKFWQIAQVKNARRAARNASAGTGAGAGSDSDADHAGAPGAAGRLPASEVMLRCAHCGVYLPASDTFTRGDQAFCSLAHRDLPR
jgi:uncharacterized protein